jgi:hypothetical protein
MNVQPAGARSDANVALGGDDLRVDSPITSATERLDNDQVVSALFQVGREAQSRNVTWERKHGNRAMNDTCVEWAYL